MVAEVETDKSAASVESEQADTYSKVLCAVDDQVAVGGVLLWLGARADEPWPASKPDAVAPTAGWRLEPTLKAARCSRSTGCPRRTCRRAGSGCPRPDVEAYVAHGRAARGEHTEASSGAISPPLAPGGARPLSLEERGMLRTVSWQRDEAVSAYLEIEFDPKPWDEHAAAFAAQHKLMMSPMLPLIAYRLVTLVRETLEDQHDAGRRPVVSVPEVNWVSPFRPAKPCISWWRADAGSMDAAGFVSTLGELQRHAIGKKLRPGRKPGADHRLLQHGAMEHQPPHPDLAPCTSLMVAHAQRQAEWPCLGRPTITGCSAASTCREC